jgi:hypothetical protein
MSKRVAIGLRAHSGWAAAVSVGGSPRLPSVVDRRRIEMADEKTPRPVQPYHASEGLPLSRAEKIVGRALEDADRFGERDLEVLLRYLSRSGHEVAACAVLAGSGRTLPSLPDILASHALIHAAEGEMFRRALRNAVSRAGLAVFEVKEKEVYTRCARSAGLAEPALRLRIAGLGRRVGPPWAEDQKLAATAAWLALAGEGR